MFRGAFLIFFRIFFYVLYGTEHAVYDLVMIMKWFGVLLLAVGNKTISYLNILVRARQNQPNDLWAQQRLRSAWVSAQSDQSLSCPHEEALGTRLSERTANQLWLRLGRFSGWSESSLGTLVIFLFLLCCRTFYSSDERFLVHKFSAFCLISYLSYWLSLWLMNFVVWWRVEELNVGIIIKNIIIFL